MGWSNSSQTHPGLKGRDLIQGKEARGTTAKVRARSERKTTNKTRAKTLVHTQVVKKKSLSLESSGMCSAWSSCLRGTNFQWISGALLQLCPRAIGTWILTKLLKHITEKHRKTGFWQFLTLTVSPNFSTVWGGYIWVQFFVFVQQFLWILLQERFLLNGFLHIPSCSAPHSMWSQTVTDGPVSFQYNLRPAIHHRGIDDHTTKCRSSILK